MREIKFRVYIKNFNRMCKVLNFEFYDKGICEVIVDNEIKVPYRYISYSLNNNEYPLEALEIMQFTGLKDINGVEIYEGDIIRIFMENRTIDAKVYYDDEYLTYMTIPIENPDDYSPENLSSIINYTLEVLGNIYDNKELLEK